MVLAQFKKDLANLQALAQKGGTYEAVSTQTQEIEEPSVEVEKHRRRLKNHRQRSKTIAGDQRIIARDRKPLQKTHLVMEQYARWILRHRRIVLTVVMLLTIALAYLASGVKLLLIQAHLHRMGILISPRPS